MPLVHVNLIEGRSPEKIKTMIAEVTDAIERTLDAPRQTIRVVVHEIPATHWGIGGQTRAELDATAGKST